jgi:hypothetical protein
VAQVDLTVGMEGPSDEVELKGLVQLYKNTSISTSEKQSGCRLCFRFQSMSNPQGEEAATLKP